MEKITSVSQIARLLPLIKNVSDTHEGLKSDRCLYYDDAPYYYTVIITIIYHIKPFPLWTWKQRARLWFHLSILSNSALHRSQAFDDLMLSETFQVYCMD